MGLLFPKKEIFPNQERSAKKRKKNFFQKDIKKRSIESREKNEKKKS